MGVRFDDALEDILVSALPELRTRHPMHSICYCGDAWA